MGNAPTPPGLLERILLEVDRRIAAFARSGFLRNATISDGGLTIKGGFLRLVHGAFNQLYFGPIGDVLANGETQQYLMVRRADGTGVLRLWDAFPDPDGTLNQALSWLDRGGGIVVADDTDSGQGLARPWLNGGFARVRYADLTVATTSATFETLWEARITKQQPRLEVIYRATMDTAAATGETRVLVNGAQLGNVGAEGFVVTTRYVGPGTVAGTHMSELVVEIQGRVTSGAGPALRVEPLGWRGRQS